MYNKRTHAVRKLKLSIFFNNLFLFLNTPRKLIEIINNTRGNIEGKIWERGYWGANSSPGCSLIHDVPGKQVILDEFFCFLRVFPRKNIENIISDCLK